MPSGQQSNGVRGAKIQKQRKKHKVVLETAGDKDDEEKLRVVVGATAYQDILYYSQFLALVSRRTSSRLHLHSCR